MKVQISGTTCLVTREAGDPKPHGVANAAGESRLLHMIKQVLNKQGYDLIKKRMWKDGHLVSDCQQYLRARKPNKADPSKDIAIYNGYWQIRGAEEDFNKDGSTILNVVNNFFEAEDRIEPAKGPRRDPEDNLLDSGDVEIVPDPKCATRAS